MPFIEADIEQEAKELQAMIDSDTEVKEHIAAFDAEYEFRRKLLLARKEAGLTQKQLGMLSGLDYRAISRAESNDEITSIELISEDSALQNTLSILGVGVSYVPNFSY